MLHKLSLSALLTLYVIAKNPKKGVYPFFKNPKAMVDLRNEVLRRTKQGVM